MLARFLSAQISGIILGQAAGGIIGDWYGWHVVFLLVGAMHLIAGLAMLAELHLNPSAQPPGATAPLGFASLARGIIGLLSRPWVRVLLITVFVEAFAMYGAFAYVGADLRQRFGLSYGWIGIVIAVYGVGAIVYSFTAKRLLGRLGERGLALAGGWLLAASFLALAAAPSIHVVPVALIALGLAFYMLHNTLQTNATQMAPEARGLGVSMFALALFLGQSAGVAIAAPVIDRWGAPPVYVVSAILLPLVALWFRARLRYRPSP